MSAEDFMRIGEAAELIAFALGRRLSGAAAVYRETARLRLLEAAQAGRLPFIAGAQTWRSAVSFPLPPECVHGLSLDLIDWQASTVDVRGGVAIQATEAIQEFHTGPSTLWVSTALIETGFGIEDSALAEWRRAAASSASRTTIDWDRFHAEITRYLMRHGVPDSREILERHMSAWCISVFGEAPRADELARRVAPHWQSLQSD
jgi:hypothetical protein